MQNLIYIVIKTSGIPQKRSFFSRIKAIFKGKSTDKNMDGNLNVAISGNVNDEIVFDLGSAKTIGSFAYQKRPAVRLPVPQRLPPAMIL